MSLLYGEAPPRPTRPVSDALYEIIESNGIEAAKDRYGRMMEAEKETYDLSEQHLNSLGYYYLGRREVETAIELFKLNVQSHPQSPNAYDSLGEAYAAAGKREDAIESYRRVLDLSPGHAGATKMLETLLSDE